MNDAQRRFLLEHGAAEVGHSSAALLSHLEGTAALLEAWGGRPALCLGGLLHSVYGTESFRTAVLPLGLRSQVQALFGLEAEALAYRFGAMEKASFYAANSPPHLVGDRFTGTEMVLDAGGYGDLCDMVVANWLEQRPRVAEEHRFIRRAEFSAMRGHLLPKARRALDAAYGF